MRSVTIATAALVSAAFGIEAAELVEVALGRPDGREAVRVGELGAFEQQPVAVAACCRVAGVGGEVEEAELHRPRAGRGRAARTSSARRRSRPPGARP